MRDSLEKRTQAMDEYGCPCALGMCWCADSRPAIARPLIAVITPRRCLRFADSMTIKLPSPVGEWRQKRLKADHQRQASTCTPQSCGLPLLDERTGGCQIGEGRPLTAGVGVTNRTGGPRSNQDNSIRERHCVFLHLHGVGSVLPAQDSLLTGSLLTRINLETSANAYSSLERPRATDTQLPLGRVPLSQSPMDEFWAIKAAMDLVGNLFSSCSASMREFATNDDHFRESLHMSRCSEYINR